MSSSDTNFQPESKAQVNINQDKIGYLVGSLHLTQTQVVQLVQRILRETLKRTIADLVKWINEYVPKRTGALRKSLIEALKQSEFQGKTLKLILGSAEGSVNDYLPFVNAMNAHNLQHSGQTIRYYSVPKKLGGHVRLITLNDPKAQGNFMRFLLMHGRQRLKANLQAVRLQECGSVGVSAKPVSDKLKVETV